MSDEISLSIAFVFSFLAFLNLLHCSPHLYVDYFKEFLDLFLNTVIVFFCFVTFMLHVTVIIA